MPGFVSGLQWSDLGSRTGTFHSISTWVRKPSRSQHREVPAEAQTWADVTCLTSVRDTGQNPTVYKQKWHRSAGRYAWLHMVLISFRNPLQVFYVILIMKLIAKSSNLTRPFPDMYLCRWFLWHESLSTIQALPDLFPFPKSSKATISSYFFSWLVPFSMLGFWCQVSIFNF